MKILKIYLSVTATFALLSGCSSPPYNPSYHYTKVQYVDSFNGSANSAYQYQHQVGSPFDESNRYWGSAQHQTRLLRQAQVSRGAVFADDSFYGVSAFSFVNCGVVDLVGSDGLGLFSVAQPVCTTTTSTLSELDMYPR